MKRILCGLLAAICCFCLVACGAPGSSDTTPGAASSMSSGSAGASSSTPAPDVSTPAAPPTDAERAAELTAGLTLEEKVGQLFFARCPENAAGSDIGAYHLGGYVLFGRDFKDLTANEIIQTLNAYQKAAAADTGIPLLLGTDEEGGTVVRVSSNAKLCKEKFRSPQRLLSDGGMEEAVYETQEKDVLLKALGINVNLAPVCDVSTNASDFMYSRTVGLDGQQTANYVSAVVSAMKEDGMGSVLKHFPGYGSNADTHTGIAVDDRPMETFTASDFLPFQSGMKAGGDTAAVLVCHNIVKSMDAELPASLSPAVHQLLREELGFDGVVMTDDLAMDAVRQYAADGNVAVLALEAGNDLLITTDYRTQIPQVLSAVKDGALDESVIDEACVRVLCWKMALGLL